MNFKKFHGILYNILEKFVDENMIVYKPVPAPVDKIKNKYRWRMIIKCKINSKTLDIIKYGIDNEIIKKFKKNTSVVVDINPNSLM